MKKKVLIGIVILCLLGLILVLGFAKKDENDTLAQSGSKDNSTYKLRSYTTSKTFYITAPDGYNYDDKRTGVSDSKAVFTKESDIDSTLTYSFESTEIDEYIETLKTVGYENKLDLDYYKDLTWQDKKNLTVNDNEITYVKITYNRGSTYCNNIYTIATIHGWKIKCEITQDSEFNKFDSDTKLINDAWEILFTEED